MTLKEAIDKIEFVCSKEGANGDTGYPLDLTSQLKELEDDKWVPEYRADIRYMYCGYFEPTIELALISLANELIRMGY
jgi:hypothetical protein